MGKFTIENLEPNKKYVFKIRKTFQDFEFISPEIEFVTPKVPKISQVNLTVDSTSNLFIKQNNVSYPFYAFQVTKREPDNSTSGMSTTRFFFNKTDAINNLTVGDKIIFNTSTNSSSVFKFFNTSSAIIIETDQTSTTERKFMVGAILKSSSFNPTASSIATSKAIRVASANHALVDTTRGIPRKLVTITVDDKDKFIDSFTIRKDIQDIIIFGYASAQNVATISDDVTKYILNSNIAISDGALSLPPAYDNVSKFKSEFRMKYIQNIDSRGSYAIFTSPARYKKINGVWIGSWINTEPTALKPIWIKAIQSYGYS